MQEKNNIEGQLNLFDMGGDESFQQTDELPSIREFPPKERLAMERKPWGFMSADTLWRNMRNSCGRKSAIQAWIFCRMRRLAPYTDRGQHEGNRWWDGCRGFCEIYQK